MEYLKKHPLMNLKSIQLKVALCSGFCLLLVASILIAYAVITLRTTAQKAAEREAQSIAEAQANMTDSEIEKALYTARTLAQSLSGMKSQGAPLDRVEVNAILRHILADNPNFLGMYTLWEPNSFDGADKFYANTKGHDQTGRFIPYWVRSGDQIIQEPLLDYEVEGIGDYYLVPKRTGQEIILDPYLYPINGQDVLLTSLVVPIIVDGKFLWYRARRSGFDFPSRFSRLCQHF